MKSKATISQFHSIREFANNLQETNKLHTAYQWRIAEQSNLTNNK